MRTDRPYRRALEGLVANREFYKNASEEGFCDKCQKAFADALESLYEERYRPTKKSAAEALRIDTQHVSDCMRVLTEVFDLVITRSPSDNYNPISMEEWEELRLASVILDQGNNGNWRADLRGFRKKLNSPAGREHGARMKGEFYRRRVRPL